MKDIDKAIELVKQGQKMACDGRAMIRGMLSTRPGVQRWSSSWFKEMMAARYMSYGKRVEIGVTCILHGADADEIAEVLNG